MAQDLQVFQKFYFYPTFEKIAQFDFFPMSGGDIPLSKNINKGKPESVQELKKKQTQKV